ncbi:MAG: glycosyltransferase [Ferruginibacter sp.]|uniref:glycosyltransferase family 4 protein n=1 Tax=Ferruginibacter sp. TaxID=1940288 RepID=UPI00265B2B7F|nr:glycosyltransferase family 4 protein [Ferruginibacter sp.]MDB5277597.1 glycosyltransferase [Ferruginibacter sp.]
MNNNKSNIHAGKTMLPQKAKRIFCTVTTDLTYDQRMIRICTSLAEAGYDVTLVGRQMKNSIPLTPQPFAQKRISCFVEKGKMFYAAYNFRLFFFLLFKKMDCIVSIDLDTILPCYFISRIKTIKRVYDAHELFCEMKEIATRPPIYATWKRIEKFAVPKFPHGYTVNQPIAGEFNKMYGVQYEVIRNIALVRTLPLQTKTEKFILYQGAVNEGRCFETLIPAMKLVDSKLIICGDGNFMEQARQLVAKNNLQQKVIFKGKITPAELRTITQQAYIGVTLFDDAGLSNYYSLANRFFDYLHAGTPQLCVNYPVYREINEQLPVAMLVDDTGITNLARQLNNLLHNEVLHSELRANCLKAREIYNWQRESKKLVEFYNRLLAN